MSYFDFLSTVKALLGITNTVNDALIKIHIAMAKQSVLNYCNISELPSALNYVLCQMVAATYRDMEEQNSGTKINGGVSSISEDGRTVSFFNDTNVTTNFENAFKERLSITTELNRYKKLYRVDDVADEVTNVLAPIVFTGDAEERLLALQNTVNMMSTSLYKLESNINNITSSIDQLNALITQSNEQIRQNQTTSQRNENSIETLSRAVYEIRQNLDTLQGNTPNIQTELDEIRNMLVSQGNTIKSVNDSVNNNISNIGTLQTRVIALDDNLADKSTAIANVNARCDTLLDNINSNTQSVQNVNNAVLNLQTSIQGLDNNLSEVRGDVQAIYATDDIQNNDISEIKNNILDATESINNLQTSLSAYGDADIKMKVVNLHYTTGFTIPANGSSVISIDLKLSQQDIDEGWQIISINRYELKMGEERVFANIAQFFTMGQRTWIRVYLAGVNKSAVSANFLRLTVIATKNVQWVE